jgi:hypothetical protein
MRTYFRLSAVVIGLLGLSTIYSVVFGQQPTSEPRSTIKQASKPQLIVKVFRLQRGTPESVIEAMNSLLEETDMQVPSPVPVPVPGVGAIPAPGGAPPALGAAQPAPGSAPMPYGGVSGFSGAIGFGGVHGLGGGVPVVNTPVWRATQDDRTKALIVRGTARHIQVAADLVALIDRPENSPLPELKVIKGFALKNANATELIAVIDALEFEDLHLSSLNDQLLVAIGPDETTKAIADLIKELDVPVKAEPEKTAPQPAPKKKID